MTPTPEPSHRSPARCLICRGEVAETLKLALQDLISKEPFSLMECPSCTVMRTVPVPHDLGRYYASDIGQMMVSRPSAIHTLAKRILLNQELQRLRKHIRPAGLLDVGAGTGDFAALLRHKGFEVATVDAQPQGPLCTRGLPDVPHYRIDYDTCEIAGLPTRPGRMVILRHVLEHVKDPPAFLTHLMAHGAVSFYIVVPNAGCLECRLLGRFWNLWDPPRHLWHFTRTALQHLLRTLDLQVVAVGYDTIPNMVPSLYRFLRLRGFPAACYLPFSPKGSLSALSAPLNLLLPHNVLWALVKVAGSWGQA